MYQRPVGVRGGEYAHLNQDKQAYFINQLFIIEYISAINYLVGVAYFFLRPKTGLRAVYLGATFLDLFPQYHCEPKLLTFLRHSRRWILISHSFSFSTNNDSHHYHIKTFLIYDTTDGNFKYVCVLL